jgi:glycosyltransferase involved in cell wall biosynthesis
VVVTESFKREIIKKGIPAEKIYVVKNGANTELFRPQAKCEELLRKYKMEGKRVLGYIGTLGMAHKIDFLIDCVKGLDDYVLMILGSGAERDNIKAKIEAENLKNVVLVDAVPKSEVVKYVALQDAALVNLRRTPLFTTVIPSKIFETASMRIPILLGVDGEAREMVEEFGAGLYYEPENKEDFLDKLNKLFSSDDVYKACCDGGAKLAEAYDRKRLAQEMLSILQK